MPAGRPTKYDPEYCEQAIEFLAQGYSITAFAGHLRVGRATIYNWADENPEFLDALNVGRAASALWWENCLRNTAETNEGSASASIFGLKNRAAEEWRDKHEVETKGGLTLQILPEDAAL